MIRDEFAIILSIHMNQPITMDELKSIVPKNITMRAWSYDRDRRLYTYTFKSNGKVSAATVDEFRRMIGYKKPLIRKE